MWWQEKSLIVGYESKSRRLAVGTWLVKEGFSWPIAPSNSSSHLQNKILFNHINKQRQLEGVFRPNQEKISVRQWFPPFYRFSETSVLLYSCVECGAFGLSLNKIIGQLMMGLAPSYLWFHSRGRLRRPQQVTWGLTYQRSMPGPAPKWSGELGRDVVAGLYTGLFSKLVPWNEYVISWL